jgi:hypothetical protein
MNEKKDWKLKDRFKLLKYTKLSNLADASETEIPTSDLCITTDEGVFQFEYVQETEQQISKVPVKPGIFTMIKTPVGVALQQTNFDSGNALESIDNTATIKKEIQTFFNKLSIYDELELQKKRSILLYGSPGHGKSFAIKKTVGHVIKDDPGTVVLIWPTSELHPEHVSSFLSFAAEYTLECTKVILIMEDIGGVEHDSGGPRVVGSGMLQLLDGVNVTFRLPTFIIATTNHPENLLSSLADRPGRFDQLIEVPSPSLEEKLALMTFIAKRELTSEEKDAFLLKGAEALSIAHLKEIVTRTKLHDKTISEVLKEMIEHSEKFNSGFQKTKKLGLR